ncbi:hypothetical protein BCR32DRAFT_251099 [Anaeromyces robustus]|uniref:Uncharacterized protein n=1 Tax=Anaeromyces robustus TaxID=1754192 RepID=A0A1Y1VTF2_9FUNG|nr:hypothetical protein BCR32DRAFT_251099 [Anaeromyces robustus]|eukprot:ORX64463.1 hypothetical protein BCR32DRAFT_251099 [Anaeromyces robustus]
MESENQDIPDLPPRPPKRINMNEELAKTISSELNSRLSSIRTSGSAATPSRISGVQLDIPTRSETINSDLFLDAEDEFVDDDEEDNAPPPPLPPRGAGVRVSDMNLEDFELPDSGPPPPVPPRGNVRVSDESLDDYDIPDVPSLPPRKGHHIEDEEENKLSEEIKELEHKIEKMKKELQGNKI